MHEPVIGILAGMGPKSTAPFIDLVISECQRQYNAKYDAEFPHIMIYSYPTPFYIDRPVDHELMKKTIAIGLKKLESFGVDFIAMPCNSSHAYFTYLSSSVRIPLLNIIDETVKEIPELPQNVTLLATETTYKTGLYQKGITDLGHNFIFKAAWQAEIDRIIGLIKSGRESVCFSAWEELLHQIRQENIECVVLACTDLNVLLKGKFDVNLVDSSKALAKAVVEKYLQLRGQIG